MSLRMMTMVWDEGPKDATMRLVLLAMADIADDNGVCWPSVATIAERSCMSDRNARRIIRKLEDEGWLATDVGRGRNSTSRYTIKKPDTAMSGQIKPDKLSARTNRAEKPDTAMSKKPDTAMSAEPSRTTIEPSEEPPKAPRDEIRLALCEVADPEAVSSFMAYRRMRKGGALTLTAAKRLASSLREISNAGFDPNDALGLAEERGWQSIKPDWYFREQKNDNRSFDPRAFGGTQPGRGGHPSGLVGAAMRSRASREI